MITSTAELPWRKNWLPESKSKIRWINVDRNVSGMELWVLPYTVPKMHLKSIFTCCNCRKSGSKDLSGYFQVFLNRIATRKRAVLRRCNFQTITLKSLENEKGGEKNKLEIIPSLAFSLPSYKLTCLEQKRKYLILLQSPRHCKQKCAARISLKRRGKVTASHFAGTASSGASPAPVKAAAGALAATWAPHVCYFKGKATKQDLKIKNKDYGANTQYVSTYCCSFPSPSASLVLFI